MSKVTGSRAWYIDSWLYEDGEAIIWRDDAADVAVNTQLGRAAIMRPLRLRRWTVIVTTKRILIAAKTFTGKRMVMYVLYWGAPPDQASNRLDGGLLSLGYTTLRVQQGVAEVHLDKRSRPDYVELRPIAAAGSSFNLAEIRIYTDSAETFRLPPAGPDQPGNG